MQPNSQIHVDMPMDDQFDRIPDSLVLVIFNRVADVRSLGRCSSVSKRFRSLVPLVHDVYLKIDRVLTIDGEAADDPLNPLRSRKPRNLFAHLARLVLAAMLNPFHQLIRGGDGLGKPPLPDAPHHSPAQVLRNFKHVRSLRIEFPAGDVGTDDGVLLRWRAEFGSTLQSCVILGGTRVDRQPHEVDDNGTMPDSFYTNGGLKLRVVWTICSLIAASTRHHLLRPIIADHPTIKSLVLTDADGQGTLSMGAEQLKEFRENPAATSASSNRTQVPASNMKMRYAPFLELPKGVGMQGATLVAVRPSVEGCNMSTCNHKKESDTFVDGAFDEPLEAAVKALVKRRTYLLEMNGF